MCPLSLGCVSCLCPWLCSWLGHFSPAGDQPDSPEIWSGGGAPSWATVGGLWPQWPPPYSLVSIPDVCPTLGPSHLPLPLLRMLFPRWSSFFLLFLIFFRCPLIIEDFLAFLCKFHPHLHLHCHLHFLSPFPTVFLLSTYHFSTYIAFTSTFLLCCFFPLWGMDSQWGHGFVWVVTAVSPVPLEQCLPHRSSQTYLLNTWK